MGLDIHVYNNIKVTNDGDNNSFTAFVISEDWKHKIKNLQENCHYIGDCADNSISYPYGAHGRFMAQLIRLIGRDDLLKQNGEIDWEKLPLDIPFIDLIDFADNEGCLDWEISEKIYNDFVEYNDLASTKLDSRTYSRYIDWLNVFQKAKNFGVVVFS